MAIVAIVDTFDHTSRYFWMPENHISLHFMINILLKLFFTKWQLWMPENHLPSHFAPFQVNKQLCSNMTTGGHFGCRKFTKMVAVSGSSGGGKTIISSNP